LHVSDTSNDEFMSGECMAAIMMTLPRGCGSRERTAG
jgi:hypothetical protein